MSTCGGRGRGWRGVRTCKALWPPRSWVCPDPGGNVLPARRRRMTNEGKWGVGTETRAPD